MLLDVETKWHCSCGASITTWSDAVTWLTQRVQHGDNPEHALFAAQLGADMIGGDAVSLEYNLIGTTLNGGRLSMFSAKGWWIDAVHERMGVVS